VEVCGEKRLEVARPDRPVDYLEAGETLDLVGGHSRRSELRHNECSMRDDFSEAGGLNPCDQLVGSERSLSGGAPHVDALGIEDENPSIDATQL
jgi:hypothetical protein